MTTEKVTITKALTVVKNLTKQLEDYSVETADLVCVCYGTDKRSSDGRTAEDVIAKIQSTHDKQDALAARLVAFKKAIKKANAETMVELYGKMISINDAIVERSFLPAKKSMLRIFKRARDDAAAVYSRMQENMEEKIRASIAASIGQNKEATNDNGILLAIEAITNQQKALYEPHIVDPRDVCRIIETLEKEISDLTTELDERLSVINATTIIEITY